MSYQGPGSYRHYKGGTYNVVGIGEHETTLAQFVIYWSDSEEHSAQRAARGADFILRPLNPTDGPDAWNEHVDGKPRFEPIAGVVKFRLPRWLWRLVTKRRSQTQAPR